MPSWTYMCWIMSLLCCVSRSVCQPPLRPELLFMLLLIMLFEGFPIELVPEFPRLFIELLPIAEFVLPPIFGSEPFNEFPILIFIEFPIDIIWLLFMELSIDVPIYCWLRPLEDEVIIESCDCWIDGIPMCPGLDWEEALCNCVTLGCIWPACCWLAGEWRGGCDEYCPWGPPPGAIVKLPWREPGDWVGGIWYGWPPGGSPPETFRCIPWGYAVFIPCWCIPEEGVDWCPGGIGGRGSGCWETPCCCCDDIELSNGAIILQRLH